ncbi:MAG: sigma-70 family RNA polymerase sigma factor [Oscillospiraceae bacterium]|nr:sigma-70 family RNA polymerase sigma factor [Oscillospiraceae bacterium]
MLNNRNEQALTETVQRYGALCRSVARNILGNDEDAEECLNDALLTVWNAIPPAKPENYCAYLLKLVRNAALDQYKSKQRVKRGSGQVSQALDELSEIFASSDNVESELEQRELMKKVTAFLSQLPRNQRDLFICRYWQSESAAKLAERFDMTENNVKVTLSRLRKRLQEYLRKEGWL